MVFIYDGNSEIGAQVRSNLCYLIYLRHLMRSRGVTNRFFFSHKNFLSFKRAQHVLSYHQSKYHGWRHKGD